MEKFLRRLHLVLRFDAWNLFWLRFFPAPSRESFDVCLLHSTVLLIKLRSNFRNRFSFFTFDLGAAVNQRSEWAEEENFFLSVNMGTDMRSTEEADDATATRNEDRKGGSKSFLNIQRPDHQTPCGYQSGSWSQGEGEIVYDSELDWNHRGNLWLFPPRQLFSSSRQGEQQHKKWKKQQNNFLNGI